MLGIIGYWGSPPPEVFKDFYDKGYREFVDLDIDYGHGTSSVITPFCCSILQNILTNALRLQKKNGRSSVGGEISYSDFS